MMNKFVAMTAVAILATTIAHIGFEADAGADGKSENSISAGEVASQIGSGNGQETYDWWRKERARRLALLAGYLKQNKEEFDSFRTAPLAIKQKLENLVGTMMIVFRLLPEIFPDIVGPPEDKLAAVGLGPSPFDPDSVLPLGQAFGLSERFSIPELGEDLQVNYVTFTCMGCHAGGVVGPDGELMRFVGGAGRIGALGQTTHTIVNDVRYNVETFQAALSEKPLGWVYNDPAQLEQEILERKLFRDPLGAAFFLEELKSASNTTAVNTELTLNMHVYGGPNAPPVNGLVPGSLDVFGKGGVGACVAAHPKGEPYCNFDEVLPAAPAPADVPAAWQMAERPKYQWDNSVSLIVFREILAANAVTAGDPAAANFDNVNKSGNFTDLLPAHPYPFDVSRPEATRGARIYRQACLGCHEPFNSILQTPEVTGTDPNRANVFTKAIVNITVQLVKGTCFPPNPTPPPDFHPECLVNGQPPTGDEILLPTGKYATTPLSGIWSTAPYLHNGSVPTLFHLLMPPKDRPATFWRGNYTYDEKLVGFTWDSNTNPSGLSMQYDTRQEGHSNAGHAGPAFNGGIDWDAEPQKLWDLLEYLKTL